MIVTSSAPCIRFCTVLVSHREGSFSVSSVFFPLGFGPVVVFFEYRSWKRKSIPASRRQLAPVPCLRRIPHWPRGMSFLLQDHHWQDARRPVRKTQNGPISA